MLPTSTTFTSRIGMFIAFIILALALTATSSIVQFDNQDEYEGFLDMINGGNTNNDKKEKMVDGTFFPRDRHQLEYIVCKEQNATSTVQRNVRCYREPSLKPACFTTYDALHGETVSGCYGYQKEQAAQCETGPECMLSVLSNRFAFCCCATHRCNRDNNTYYGKLAYDDFKKSNILAGGNTFF